MRWCEANIDALLSWTPSPYSYCPAACHAALRQSSTPVDDHGAWSGQGEAFQHNDGLVDLFTLLTQVSQHFQDVHG